MQMPYSKYLQVVFVDLNQNVLSCAFVGGRAWQVEKHATMAGWHSCGEPAKSEILPTKMVTEPIKIIQDVDLILAKQGL